MTEQEKKDQASKADDAQTPEPSVELPDEEAAAEPEAEPAGEEQQATPEDELAQAKAEAAEARDRFLRLQAEWDNFRKRSAAERADERARACERIVTDLLPVIDDFDRALDVADSSDLDSFVAGVRAVHGKLVNVLEKENVSIIDPTGEAFDTARHQAVGKKDDASVPDETVVEVYQKGYEMGGRVLRPAMVVISSGGPARPKTDEDDASSEDDNEK
ncbi:MAG: nucleotide exchange factor GrpE [Coriobacteriales bacterium]